MQEKLGWFNSQHYDLPHIKHYLHSALQRLDALPNSVKEKSYMLLATKRLKYNVTDLKSCEIVAES